MIKIDGKNYKTVQSRVLEFRTDHPMGVIRTKTKLAEGLVIAHAEVQVRTKEGELVSVSTGTGSSVLDLNSQFRSVESAETAAVGRALAFFGYGTEDLPTEEHPCDSPRAIPEQTQAPAPRQAPEQAPQVATPTKPVEKPIGKPEKKSTELPADLEKALMTIIPFNGMIGAKGKSFAEASKSVPQEKYLSFLEWTANTYERDPAVSAAAKLILEEIKG